MGQIETLNGGCFCGAIRYSINVEPFRVTNCHCSQCRHSAAAPFMTWMGVDAAGVSIEGELRTHLSSESGSRGFCPTCGTQIAFFLTNDANRIFISVASLENPNAVAPTVNMFVADGVGWIHIDDGLARQNGMISDIGPAGDRR